MTNQLLINTLKDPKKYLESFCKIKTKDKGLQPFILKEAQKDLFNTIRRHNRIIILKARQGGFSSAVTGFAYHKAITTEGINIALIGYNNDLTSELLDKIKTFYRTTPDTFKPTIQYNTKFEISFPKTHSKIMVLPSTENIGRGYTLHFVLCTELPFWDKAEEKMTTLEASVPINGTIIIESTPGNVGDLFHRMWMSEDNGYEKKEYGWWWYYTEEEIDQIRKRINNPRKFAQNYSLEFASSGRAVFPIETIRACRKNVKSVGDEMKLKSGESFRVKEEEGWRVYMPPEEGTFYSCGVDTAEGVSGGDFTVATILNRTNGEEVAMWRGHLAPDRVGVMLDKWGRKYNNALMVVESEAHGNVVINILKQLLYPCMYYRPARFETIATQQSEKLGWKTTKLTRPILIDEYEQAVREKSLTIHSKELVDEMTVFIFNDANDMQPIDGYHDDCIFSAAISFQGFKMLSTKIPTQLDYERHMPKVGGY